MCSAWLSSPLAVDHTLSQERRFGRSRDVAFLPPVLDSDIDYRNSITNSSGHFTARLWSLRNDRSHWNRCMAGQKVLCIVM